MKIATFLIAMLAATGLASATAEVYVEAETDEETHSVYLYVTDDGTATLFVDGEQVGLPSLGETPTAPEVPIVPAAPGVPTIPLLP